VTEQAERVIKELMKPDVRDQMLRLDSADPSVLLPLNANHLHHVGVKRSR